MKSNQSTNIQTADLHDQTMILILIKKNLKIYGSNAMFVTGMNYDLDLCTKCSGYDFAGYPMLVTLDSNSPPLSIHT